LERRRTIIYATFVALIGALVFAPAVTGGWLYDDHTLIQANPYVHSFHDWPRWFVTDFWNVDEEVVRFGSRILYWRPAVTAGYALDWQLGGGSPVLFHITNLVLQAATSALAFFALRRWLGGAALPALATAALFVVHPTKAESVAWIAGRTDIVCMLAVLVAAAGMARRRAGHHGGIALEVAGTVLAYLSKEQAIVLPCFAAMETWVALGRPPLDRPTLVRLVRGALPQAGLAIAYLALRMLLMPIRGTDIVQHVPPLDHALAVAETFGRYIVLGFAPHDLSIQQGLVHAIHHDQLHALGYVVIGVVSTVALVALAIATRKTRPVIAIGVALYFATALPTSNIAWTGMRTLISERFLYLPLIGLALVAGELIRLAEARWGRKIYAVVAAAVLALSIGAVRRAADYRDEDAFWDRELALHPDSAQARSAAVARDLEAKRYYAALRILQTPSPYDPMLKEELVLAFQVAAVMAQIVPDRATAELEAIDKFCADLIAKQPARLELRGVTFALDLSQVPNDTQLVEARPRFLSLRADLQSRLGLDQQATELAAKAIEDCPRCASLVALDALVLARATRYDDALALLAAAYGHMPAEPLDATRAHIEDARALFEQGQRAQGPAALQAHASEFAKLEAWGRAFTVLAPYEAEITRAPRFAVGFAELAFRAGEEATARRVLAAAKSPAEIDALIAEWTAKMGWTT